VVIAKWLARNTKVILFDEPTRGIDVGAKFEIYQLMNKLAGEGKAIVMVSSELPEILGMSDRIIVMREGQIAGELENRDGLTQEEVLALAMEGEVAA
jgi:ABC-type sugar transport system ATPase subunit